MSWRDHAACKGMDPELFFTNHTSAAVKRTCAACPVRVPCLEDALTLSKSDDLGYRGGLPQTERRLIRSTRRRGIA